MFLTVLDQDSILDFLLGSDLNYEQFLGHYIFDLEALLQFALLHSVAPMCQKMSKYR